MIDRGYSVATRDKLKLIEQEMKLQGSGLTTDDGAAHLGKIANVSAVLVVTINQSQSETHTENGTTTSREQVGRKSNGKAVYGNVQRPASFQVSSAAGGVSAKMIAIETATAIWTGNFAAASHNTADSASVIDSVAVTVANALPPKEEPPPSTAPASAPPAAAQR